MQKQKGGVGKIDVRNIMGMNEALESITKFGHYVYDGKRWVEQRMEDHQRVDGLHIMVDKTGYVGFGVSVPENVRSIETNKVATIWAQMMLMSPALALELGVKENEMLLTEVTIRMATGTLVEVMGSILIILIYGCDGKKKHRLLIYIVIGVSHLYLSKATLWDIGLLPDE